MVTDDSVGPRASHVTDVRDGQENTGRVVVLDV